MAQKKAYRCLMCGKPNQNLDVYTWEHKHQAFMSTFGGKDAQGHGMISHDEISDPDYDKVMLAQLERVANSYGMKLVKA